MARLKFLLRCAASVALIVFVLHKVNWAQLELVLKQLDFRCAIPASSLVLLLIASLAFRWSIFLRQQAIQLPFGIVFQLTWAGQFFNSVLPGSTGGDVVKIYQLCRFAPQQKAAAAASVLVDRFSAFLALVILVMIALSIDPVPLQEIRKLGGSVQSILLLAGAVLVVGVVALWMGFRLIRSSHWLGRLQRTFAAIRNSVSFNGKFFAAMSISFGIHCLSFFIVFLFARSLRIEVTFFQVMLIFPVVLLLVMLPVTVNGHGLREVLLIFYFDHLHIVIAGNAGIGVRETAVALSLVCVANDLLWSLPGGLWYMTRFKQIAN